MQTFLPESDFDLIAQSLDSKRLMKQRIENFQILKSLAGLYESGAWSNHPAVRMWDGHEDWLLLYNESIIKEVIKRGYKDTTREQFIKVYWDNFWGVESDKPWWLDLEELHYSHKGRLYEKDPEHYWFYSEFADYRNIGYVCCDTCNYFWPTHKEKNDTSN